MDPAQPKKEEDNGNESDEAFVEDDEVGEEILLDGQAHGEEDGDEGGATEGGDDFEEFQDDSIQGFFDHTDSVFAVALSPTNPDIAATGGGDDKAFLWNIRNGDRLHELKGVALTPVQLLMISSFNFDGTLIATGGLDALVKVWNVATGELVKTLEGAWLAWHPRGNIVLVGTEGGTAWMWLTATGACVNVFAGHRARCTCGGFSVDGKKVITGSEDATVRIWNPKTAAVEFVVSGHMFHDGPVVSMGFHHDGNLIITGGTDGRTCIVNINTGKSLGALHGHTDTVESVGFCKTLPLAASGSIDGTMRVWDLNTMQPRLTCKHQEAITHLRWHPTLPIVITSSMDCTVKAWDARTGALLRSCEGHIEAIVALAVSVDGTIVVTGGDDHHALVFSSQPTPHAAAAAPPVAATPPPAAAGAPSQP